MFVLHVRHHVGHVGHVVTWVLVGYVVERLAVEVVEVGEMGAKVAVVEVEVP